MMKRIMLLAAALAAAGIAGIAAEGGRYDVTVANPTGGVSRAMCRVGTVARLDYSLDAPGRLDLVRAVGSTVLSVTTITNAAAAAAGSVSGLGVVGGDDYVRLTCATNAQVKIYIITQ